MKPGDVLASFGRGPGVELRVVYDVAYDAQRCSRPFVALRLVVEVRSGWRIEKAFSVRVRELGTLIDALERVRAHVVTLSAPTPPVRFEVDHDPQRRLP